MNCNCSCLELVRLDSQPLHEHMALANAMMMYKIICGFVDLQPEKTPRP